MPDSADPLTFWFDEFQLGKAAGVLLRHQDGQTSRVQLGPRAFQLLCLLVERRGAIVTRQEIMDTVWPNLTVEENNLSVQLSNLRRALDADREGGSCIQTLPGRGYRLLPSITSSPRWRAEEEPHNDVTDRTLAADIPNLELPSGPGPKQVGAAAAPSPPPEPFAEDRRRGTSGIGAVLLAWCQGHYGKIAAGVACLFFLIALLAWFAAGWPWPHTRSVVASASTPVSKATAPAAPSIQPSPVFVDRWRLPIAVLPFTWSGDGIDEPAADGVADSLSIDLSQFPGLRVIARQAAVAYTAQPTDIKRIGQELAVRYLVAGSIRRAAGALRISAQLLSAESGEQVWAERFDIGQTGDSRTTEDVARQIAFMAAFRAIDAEAARSLQERPHNPTASDILARARSVYNLPPGPDRDTSMLALYERAVELDPAYPAGLAGLAESLLARLPIWTIWNEDPRAPPTFRQADTLISRAESLSPTSRHVMLARMQLVGRQAGCPAVIPVAQRTMEMHPTLASPHAWQGICLLLDGKAGEAIHKFNDAIHVNPRNPSIDNFHRMIGYALLFQNLHDEAVTAFRTAVGSNPSVAATLRGNDYAAIAAAQALAGDLAAARDSAAEAVRLWPTITARGYYPFKVTSPIVVMQVAHLRDGLRLAGIRDHADEDADIGLPADDLLHDTYDAPTPISVPGAQTIRTPDLAALLRQRKLLILDANPFGETINGAIGLWGAGIAGSLSDEYQERLGRKMAQLTNRDRAAPVVTVGWNAERHQGRNLALRLVALGYTKVYWYRGGRESWLSANLPAAEVTLQDW